MKEQDIIDLGFEKYEVTSEESGGESFYYYTYKFGEGDYDLSLITIGNTEVIDDEWYVDIFEYGEIKFTKREDLEMFISLISRNMPIG